jgi:hypothetical protein
MARMTELLDTLHRVKERIERYRSKGINEQDTKGTLIQPVLRSLGWDVEDLEEVQREYKIRKQDKPVDFALFLLRTPCLFVEAKGLGQNLDDRKWANQIMGYAGVAGVGWVVLTDGNEYRVYNSHAAVPIDEKLFRTVKVAEDPSLACETLALMSKERMRKNEMSLFWKSHFVDRQVQLAIRNLFSSTPDPSIVRLVSKKVPGVAPKEIRASLQRASVNFDFPVKPSINDVEISPPKPKRPKGTRGTRTLTRNFLQLGFKMSQVVSQLIEAGVMRPGTSISADYRGQTLQATITSDGQVDFRGAKYKSPSAAGAAAKQFVSGKYLATDGWTFWHYTDGDGVRVPLSIARDQYIAKRKSVKN